jgi:transposase
MTERKPYPTDVSDEAWSFAAPYLTLMIEDAPQRRYELRERFNALRWMARAGASWRMPSINFPPWELVYQQTQRWLNASCFEAMVSDLRSVIQVAQERQGQPSAAELARQVQQATGQTVKLAFADLGYTGNTARQAAHDEGVELQIIKLPEAKKGFVLLPCRCVVERSFSWLNRFRRLAQHYDRLPETLAGLHFIFFAMLRMLAHVAPTVEVPNTL